MWEGEGEDGVALVCGRVKGRGRGDIGLWEGEGERRRVPMRGKRMREKEEVVEKNESGREGLTRVSLTSIE
jgi:hypothetical protein